MATKQPKAGQPELPDYLKRKPENFRINAVEKRKIKTLAKRYRLPWTKYVRLAALQELP